jgi:hypothetical protein
MQFQGCGIKLLVRLSYARSGDGKVLRKNFSEEMTGVSRRFRKVSFHSLHLTMSMHAVIDSVLA